MPELPEVETIRQDLIKTVKGKKIIHTEILTEMLIKKPSLKLFEKNIRGKTITDIKRRGKYLLFLLDSKKCLIIHLKLTGVLIYQPKKTDYFKETRVVFHFEKGDRLIFNDQRKFAAIYLVKNPEEINGIAKMGPEPLDEEFTLSRFGQMIRQKHIKIKPLLMDQNFIAGIGNIYASEALYLSRILPQRKTDSLSGQEIALLFRAIKRVLKKAVDLRGTSIDNYRDLSGNKGDFIKKLTVYGRAKEPCYKCKTIIIRESMGGRGTFFCPVCQK